MRKGEEPQTFVAARLLLAAGARDIAPFVIEQLARWSVEHRLGLLESVVGRSMPSEGDPEVVKIADHVLAGFSSGVGPWTGREAGLAALALVENGERSAGGDLAHALRRAPDEPLLWLTQARVGQPQPDLAQLAQRVYLDQERAMTVRVAAAASAAAHDARAEALVSQAYQEYLARHGNTSLQTLIAAFPAPEAKNDYRDLRENLRLIGFLRFLPPEIAEPWLLEAAHAENELIRKTAALVMVLRWPLRFLELDPGIYEGLAYDQMVALLVDLHPVLAPRARSRVPEERLRAALELVQAGDLTGLFGLSGSAVSGL